jgi:hypothetical protein
MFALFKHRAIATAAAFSEACNGELRELPCRGIKLGLLSMCVDTEENETGVAKHYVDIVLKDL